MKKYDTLKYYNENAVEYTEQTKYGDLKEIYAKFLKLLPNRAHILDFGCGSGRDSKYFIEHGYTVTAIDGSEKMCELATKYIGQKVKCMKFDELLDDSQYDGIWACSSILHVEREKLADILKKMYNALKYNGIIYASFKIGDYFEIKEGKYYNYITKDILENMLKNNEVNLEIIDYFETVTDIKVNRTKANWGNYLLKKVKIIK